MNGKDNENINMIYSGVVIKDGRKRVGIRFERDNGKGKKPDFAEAMLPDHHIVKSEGFSEEEIVGLEYYLQNSKDDILKKAKEITNIMHLMGGDKK